MTFCFHSKSVSSLILIFAGFLALGCSSEIESPEAEVRRWLAEAEESAEAKRLGDLADQVHADYSDARGNDKVALLRQLRLYGFAKGSRELIISVDSLDVSVPDIANLLLAVRFAATGGAAGRFNAGHYQVKLELRRGSDGDWSLLNARWAPAGEPLR